MRRRNVAIESALYILGALRSGGLDAQLAATGLRLDDVLRILEDRLVGFPANPTSASSSIPSFNLAVFKTASAIAHEQGTSLIGAVTIALAALAEDPPLATRLGMIGLAAEMLKALPR